MNFGLRHLFAIFAVSAFSIAALTQPTRWMMWLYVLFTLTLLVTSIIFAFTNARESKSFWIWFSIASMGYLALAYIPDINENIPRREGPEPTTRLLVIASDLLGFNPYKEPKVVDLSGGDLSSIHLTGPLEPQERTAPEESLGPNPFEGFGGGGFGGGNFGGQNSSEFGKPPMKDFSELIDMIDDLNLASDYVLPYVDNISGMEIYYARLRKFHRFMVIGHFVWAILLGVVLGSFSHAVSSRISMSRRTN